jgi:putative sterol carrier protein
MSIQYRVAFGKKDEAVEGPDDADVVVRIDVKNAALDPTVAYMTGKLKAEGHTGRLLEALWSGDAATVISRLALRP